MKWPKDMADDSPKSVHSWLVQQLHSRGIDAKLYSKSVLSLLTKRWEELSEDQIKKFTYNQTSVKEDLQSEQFGEFFSDDVRKMTAVEYLSSVSKEASDIKSLVEELYARVKDTQNDECRKSPKKVLHEIQLHSSTDTEDPAQRYYAAFPALSDKSANVQHSVELTPEHKAWARVASAKHGPASSESQPNSNDSGSDSSKGSDEKLGPDKYGQNKYLWSSQKEEKGKKTLENKHRQKNRRARKFVFSYRDGNKDAESARNNKKSPNYNETRHHYRRKSYEGYKGKALFREDTIDAPPRKSAFKGRRNFPEFHQPSFIVPKTSVTPKKNPVKCEKISPQSIKYGRCRSEEKANVNGVKMYFHKCPSDYIQFEQDDNYTAEELVNYKLKYIKNSEQGLWYTKPMDDFIMPAQLTKQRLYERNHEFLDDSLNSEDEDDKFRTFGNKEYNLSNSPMEDFEYPILEAKSVKQHGNEPNGFRQKDTMDVFTNDYLETLSRDSSYSNIQDTFGFGYVPPNTPENLQHSTQQLADALGLASLVQLAKQMKTLSQEEQQDNDLFSRFTTQEDTYIEHGMGTEESDNHYTFLKDILSKEKQVLDNETEDLVDHFEDFELEDEAGIPTPLSNGSPIDSVFSQNDKEGNERDLIIVNDLNTALDYCENPVFMGIPTPLSHCSSFIESEGEVNDADSDVHKWEMEQNNNNNHKDAQVIELHSPTNENEDETWSSICYAAHLGHQDVLKQLDLDSSCDSDSPSFLYKNGHRDGDGHVDDEAAQYTMANCDIVTESHLIWWDLSGKPSIWSCNSEVTNSHWGDPGHNMKKLWNESEVALQNRSLASRPSPLREYFSPRFDYDLESRIWDINMQMINFCSPLDQNSQFSPPSVINVKLTANFSMTFIEGGLYGNEWDSLLENIHDKVDFSTIFHNTPLLLNSSTSSSPKALTHEIVDNINVSVPSNIPKVPSEHSAFSGVSKHDSDCSSPLPNGPIHHVQSEPILTPENSKNNNDFSETHYRMIEVKHLYKSDTSILRQLGLASGTDAEETDQSDSIEYSPDRHFVPIQTPLVDKEHSIDTVMDAVTVVPEEILVEKGSLENNWTPYSNFKSSSRNSIYQLYLEENTEDLDLRHPFKITCNFVPSFKVHKEFEKCAQTGDDDSDLCEDTEDYERSLSERLLTDMKSVLEVGDECVDDGEHLTMKDLNDSIQHADSSDYEEVFPIDQSADGSCVNKSAAGIANLWKERSSSDPSFNADEGNVSTSLGKSIWSRGLESDIPLVTTELISGSNDPQGDMILDTYAASDDNFENYIYQDWSTGDAIKELNPDHPCVHGETPTPSMYSKPLRPLLWGVDYNEQVFMESDLDAVFTMDPLEQRPVEGPCVYSNQLEEKWLQEQNTEFRVQVPRAKQVKKKGSGRKPCSFFLEGSCQRKDCKFAHDTASITCKFWEDDECFKGVTCPFLHGYAKVPSTTSLLRKLHKKNKQKEFKLESGDFPELSKSLDSSDPSHSDGSDSKRGSQSGIPSPKPLSKEKKRKNGAKSKSRTLPLEIKFKSSC